MKETRNKQELKESVEQRKFQFLKKPLGILPKTRTLMRLIFVTYTVVALVLLITLIGSVMMVKNIGTTSISTFSKELAEKQINNLNVDDIESYKNSTDPNNTDSEEYKKLHDKLKTINSDSGALYTYLLYSDDSAGDKAKMLLANMDSASSDYIQPGSESNTITSEDIQKAVDSTEAISLGEEKDGDNSYVTSLVPIKDSTGSVIAVLGVDYDSTSIHEINNKMLNSFVLKFLLICVIAFAFASFILVQTFGAEFLPLRYLKVASDKLGENKIDEAKEILDSYKPNLQNDMTRLYESQKQSIKSLDTLVLDIDGAVAELNSNAKVLKDSMELSNEVSKEITQRAGSLIAGSELQVESTKESSSATSEVATALQRMAENITDVADISSESYETSRQGLQSAEDLVTTIDKFQAENEKVIEDINKMIEQHQKIEKVLADITNIADQTNLLSLNASIEAARAGEHGKGFAVVAQEVRKLADESKTSVQEIGDLLNTIKDTNDSAVKSIDRASESLKVGVDAMLGVKNSFGTIVDKNQTLDASVQEVSAALEEVSASAEELSASIDTIAEVATESSSNLKEVSAQLAVQDEGVQRASTELHEVVNLADKLEKEIAKYK